jgi:hypothetical protein
MGDVLFTGVAKLILLNPRRMQASQQQRQGRPGGRMRGMVAVCYDKKLLCAPSPRDGSREPQPPKMRGWLGQTVGIQRTERAGARGVECTRRKNAVALRCPAGGPVSRQWVDVPRMYGLLLRPIGHVDGHGAAGRLAMLNQDGSRTTVEWAVRLCDCRRRELESTRRRVLAHVHTQRR